MQVADDVLCGPGWRSSLMIPVNLGGGTHWRFLWMRMEEFIDDIFCEPGCKISLLIPVGLDRGIHWCCLLWAWMEELIDHSCVPRWRSSLTIPLGLDGGAHWWCLCGSGRSSSLMMSSADLHGGVVSHVCTSHPPVSFLHRAYFLSSPLAFL